VGYSSAELEYVYLNSETKETEICPAAEKELYVDKASILARFERDIEDKTLQIKDIQSKRDYFLKYFNRFFHEEKTKETVV